MDKQQQAHFEAKIKPKMDQVRASSYLVFIVD